MVTGVDRLANSSLTLLIVACTQCGLFGCQIHNILPNGSGRFVCRAQRAYEGLRGIHYLAND